MIDAIPHAEVLQLRPGAACLFTYRQCLKRIACAALLSFCFPYLTPVRTSTDLQPFSLLLAFCVLLCAGAKSNFGLSITKPLALLVVPALYSILVSIAYGKFEVRSVAGYFCLVLFAWAGYTINREGLASQKLVCWSIGIWALAAMLEASFSGTLLLFLLPRVSTSAGRGVVGLAPEPFHYAATLLMMFILIRFCFMKGLINSKWYWWSCLGVVFQVALLARSASIALSLVLYPVLLAIFPIRPKRLLVVFALLLATYFSLRYMRDAYADVRIVSIGNIALENPQLLLAGDASIDERVSHIAVSFHGFWSSLPFAFGHGTAAWSTYLQRTLLEHFSFLPESSKGDRIMSAYGSALFELGYAGLIIPAVQLYSFARQKEAGMAVLGLFLAICMLHAVPLSHPLFGFILGTSEFMRQRDRTNLSPLIARAPAPAS